METTVTQFIRVQTRFVCFGRADWFAGLLGWQIMIGLSALTDWHCKWPQTGQTQTHVSCLLWNAQCMFGVLQMPSIFIGQSVHRTCAYDSWWLKFIWLIVSQGEALLSVSTPN